MSIRLLRPGRTALVSAALASATTSGGRALAGGTDLLVQHRAGTPVDTMVDLSSLSDAPPAVVDTSVDGRPAVRLSAVAPLSAVAAGVRGRFASLTDAEAVFASEQIRNRATIGGNLATGSPGADTVPPLLAAGAVVDLLGPDGERHVPLADFLLGPRRVDLRDGEWIHTVTVPLPPQVSGFRKVGGRQALAISFLNLAWQWRTDDAGRLHDVRLAMGALAPTVVRLTSAEAVLEGQQLTADVLAAAAESVAADIRPIDDLRASAAYRRRAAAGLLTEVLHGALPQPQNRQEEN